MYHYAGGDYRLRLNIMLLVKCYSRRFFGCCTVPGYPGGLLAVLGGVPFIYFIFYFFIIIYLFFFFLFASRGGFIVGLLYYIFLVFSLSCLQWI